MNISKLRKLVQWYPENPDTLYPALRNLAAIVGGAAAGLDDDIDDQIGEIENARGLKATGAELVRFCSLYSFQAALRLIERACRFQLASEYAAEFMGSDDPAAAEPLSAPEHPPLYPMPGELWEDCDGTKGVFVAMLPNDVCWFKRCEDGARWEVPLSDFRDFFAKCVASAPTESPPAQVELRVGDVAAFKPRTYGGDETPIAYAPLTPGEYAPETSWTNWVRTPRKLP